ncbi:MAG: HAD family hydrolase [Gammaproteobacteria bacterium]
MKTTFKGLLFDLDGTLLDTAPELAQAANTLYKKYGKPEQPFDILRPLAGDGAMAFIELVFGTGNQNQSALRQEFIDIYLTQFGQYTEFFPGVETLIQHFDEIHYPWGIVTNKPRYLTKTTLQRFPLLDKALIVVCGDTLKKGKPHPEPVLHACKKLALTPAECAFIGDHERDIIAGRAAGTFTMVARYGYLSTNTDPADWHANVIIDKIDEVYNWI